MWEPTLSIVGYAPSYSGGSGAPAVQKIIVVVNSGNVSEPSGQTGDYAS